MDRGFLSRILLCFHHFLNDDQPQEDCIPPDSRITWDKLFKRDTVAGKLFSFMESNKFRIFIPEQAAIDAFLDGDMDSSLQSPKHKFQIYCFQDRCSLLIELYLQQTIPPYGAHYEPIQYPEDRCQLIFELDVLISDTKKIREHFLRERAWTFWKRWMRIY